MIRSSSVATNRWWVDATAYWDLLTPKDNPIPQPGNLLDSSLCPPTEMDCGSTNAKFAMKEKFERPPFTGTNKKMMYVSCL